MDELLNWVRRQANKAGFTIVIQSFCLINHMVRLVSESVTTRFSLDLF